MTLTHNDPLVSILITTYNSAKYVLETLESAKSQIYRNIELIVSDDASTDNTVEICQIWIDQNKERFMRSQVITVDKNTGIGKNCNRALRSCNGEWVKFIAGDDILSGNCIESFVQYCKDHPSVKVVESISQYFYERCTKECYLKTSDKRDHPFFNSNSTAYQQYQILLRRNLIHAPSVFLNREAIVNVGGFDETDKLFEDHPLWLKLTKKGIKIYYLPVLTVFYRLHGNSIFASVSDDKIYNKFYLYRRQADIKYIYPSISFIERIFYDYEYYRKKTIDAMGLNRNNIICKMIYYGSYKMSPNNLLSTYIIKKIEHSILRAKSK
jgi:glycosyltransferase involved in cell wall biosynthesis